MCWCECAHLSVDVQVRDFVGCANMCVTCKCANMYLCGVSPYTCVYACAALACVCAHGVCQAQIPTS